MHYLTIETETGLVRGTVSSAVAAVSEGEQVIALTNYDEAWLGRAIATQAGEDWQVEMPPAPPVDLAQLKHARKAGIDTAAERERLRWITGGAGQAMTYQAKVEEARRLVADPEPVQSSYPMLAAEIGITAPDLAGVAGVVSAAYEQWLAIGAAIEGVRLAAKRAVDEAEDAAAVSAITVSWPEA